MALVGKKTELRQKYEAIVKSEKETKKLLNIMSNEKDCIERNKYADPKTTQRPDGSYIYEDHILYGGESWSPRLLYDYEKGGYLDVSLKDSDLKGKYVAFVLERQYSEPSAGVTYNIDFGVLDAESGKVWRSGWQKARDGANEENDDYAKWYNEVKIIEEREGKVLLGLKSGYALDIYEINIANRNATHIERHDLLEESRLAEVAELEKKAAGEQDFQKRLEILCKKLRAESEDSVYHIFEVIDYEGEKLGIISAVFKYNQNPIKIDFYMVRNQEEPLLLLQHSPKYRYDGHRGKYYYLSVDMNLKIENGELAAVIGYEAKEDAYDRIRHLDHGKEEVTLIRKKGATAQSSKTKLLVVDDEEVYRACWGMLFCKNFEVLNAKSFEGAKKILEQHGKDIGCIITDMNFPEKDGGIVYAHGKLIGKPCGEDLIRHIKKNYPDIAVIANSSKEKFVELALVAGADEALKKPLDSMKLLEMVLAKFDKKE